MATTLKTAWKSTLLCVALNCECGHSSHVDSWFAYHVRCPGCGAIYKLADEIPVTRVDRNHLYPHDLVAVEGQPSDIARRLEEVPVVKTAEMEWGWRPGSPYASRRKHRRNQRVPLTRLKITFWNGAPICRDPFHTLRWPLA